MRHTCTRHIARGARLCLTVVLLGLWGCGSEPAREPEPTPPPVVVEPPPVVPQKASLTLPPSAYSEQFLKADQLLTQNQWMAASEVIGTVPVAGLSASDTVYLGYLQARIDYIRGRHKEALAQLDTLDHQDINTAQRYRILNLRRHIMAMSENYLESARLGDEILRLAPATDSPALQRSIWHDLQRINTGQLEQAAPAAVDAQWRDWLELALLTRAPLPAQLQSLPLWLQNNPQHPAANPLPGGLGYLLSPPAAQKVALILPLSDRLAPAGRAVRDGYLASYYAYQESGGPAFDILVLDQDSFSAAGQSDRFRCWP
jgi:outer membrane PBP1 activator LpoA protein